MLANTVYEKLIGDLTHWLQTEDLIIIAGYTIDKSLFPLQMHFMRTCVCSKCNKFIIWFKHNHFVFYNFFISIENGLILRVWSSLLR